MYPRGIVDSDEYSPKDNLVLLTTKKQIKKPQSQCYHFPSVHCWMFGDGSQLAQFLLNPGAKSIMVFWFSKEWGTLKVVVQCEKDIVYLMQNILLIPPKKRNGGNREM